MHKDNIRECDFTEYSSPFIMDRREFLKTFGGGIFIFFTFNDPRALLAEEPRRSTAGLFSGSINALLKIGEDGRITCLSGKIEMGQGIVTSLAQMLADELDVSLDAVDMIMGDTRLCPYDRGTWGSQSTPVFGPQLRAAGAETRRILLHLAAQYLKVPVTNLTVKDGIVYDRSNKDNQVSYVQLVKGRQIQRHLKETVHLKDPSEFKIINTEVNRRDALKKVTGNAQYAADVILPGMLYAKILRPPAHGTKLLDVDLSEVQKIDDVRVIQDRDMIAVLHKYPDVAEAALKKIKPEFSPSASNLDDKNIFDHLLKTASPPRITEESGIMQKGREISEAVFEQTYLDGYVAHAPMEPHAALAHIEDGKLTVWASTQNPFGARDMVAQAIGIASENVRVITPFVGGGFGGKTHNLQVVEAALLAKLSGSPVQVSWNREEEFFYDYYRPAAVVKINSGITGQGQISFWDYHVYAGGARGTHHYYTVPHQRTSVYGPDGQPYPEYHPVFTGAWRAPGNNTNTFARESQIDMMAARAGVDPLIFRLNHVYDHKMRRVLETAAKAFGWTPAAKSPSGRGWGIACGTDVGVYVATIAEVEVDKTSGNVQVKRVVCAQDMGLVINPAGAKIQIEGGVTMGLGYALTEDIHFKDGEIFDSNFDTYEIPRFSALPKIDPVLIDDKNAPALGGGEPAIITMGGVIANAIYDAIGVRVFQMPMTPQRIKKAIEANT